MKNAGLDVSQAGIQVAGRNIKNLRYVDDTTLMAESEEDLKSEKAGFKTQRPKTEDHGIWSHHFMSSRWENNGNRERL